MRRSALAEDRTAEVANSLFPLKLLIPHMAEHLKLKAQPVVKRLASKACHVLGTPAKLGEEIGILMHAEMPEHSAKSVEQRIRLM